MGCNSSFRRRLPMKSWLGRGVVGISSPIVGSVHSFSLAFGSLGRRVRSKSGELSGKKRRILVESPAFCAEPSAFSFAFFSLFSLFSPNPSMPPRESARFGWRKSRIACAPRDDKCVSLSNTPPFFIDKKPPGCARRGHFLLMSSPSGPPVRTVSRVWRRWHKWGGLFFSCFLIPFLLSGLVLNHREALRGVDVSRAYLPPSYRLHNWNQGTVRGTLPLSADRILLYGENGLFLSDARGEHIRPFNEGLRAGAPSATPFGCPAGRSSR